VIVPLKQVHYSIRDCTSINGDDDILRPAEIMSLIAPFQVTGFFLACRKDIYMG